VEADLRAQVASLQTALEEKDKDMRVVMATVDCLQKTPGEGNCFCSSDLRVKYFFKSVMLHVLAALQSINQSVNQSINHSCLR
jgi:hypothetical protein